MSNLDPTLDDDNSESQKIQVLHNRVIPGSIGTIEQLIIANHAVVVVASTSKKGRVKASKRGVSVGGADLEVILSELRPDGNESYVQAGQLRASYRQTDASSTPLQPVMYGRPDEVAPLVPGETTQVRIPIPDFAHTFRAGSAIRITVNTPGGDQPRWAYELLGLGAETTHTVVLGGPNASSVLFPVAGNRTAEVPLPACPSLRGQPCRPTPPAQ